MGYYFFFKGPLSQWYSCTFKLDGIRFNCAEQYMMFKKAELFNDNNSMINILYSRYPSDQKNLGRKVSNFNAEKWESVARDIVYKGNMAKFTQNSKLLEILLNTAPNILVEASPKDKIWGIGLSEEIAKKVNPEQWPGKNWLGLVLTKVRNDIKNGYNL